MGPATEGHLGRQGFWLGMPILLLCLVFTVHLHLSRHQTWLAELDSVDSGYGVMATLDAYYYLRWADKHLAGTYEPLALDPLRHYQRLQYEGDPPVWRQWRQAPQWLPQLQPRELPLLSSLLALGSEISATTVDEMGIVLPPLLSSLFMLPLFLYAWRTGLPVAGLMAALTTAFSHAYFSRSGAGWVDTDVLNLFFPWMIALLILHAGLTEKPLSGAVLSVCAGISMQLYFYWYPRPGLAIVFLGTLLLTLALQGRGWRSILVCTVLFILAANPMQFLQGIPSLLQFAETYLAPPVATNVNGELGFPDIMATVSEVRGIGARDVFSAITRPAEFAMVGLAGFFIMSVLNWRMMLPTAPLLLLGLLSFYSSQRFVIYLAPFVGLGLGWLLWQAVAGVASIIGRPATALPTLLGGYVAVICLFYFGMAPGSAMNSAFQPALAAPLHKAIVSAGTALPGNSRAWTWWDTGFMLPHTSGLAVYHDGGAQKSPQTYLVARSLTSTDPLALHSIIHFVDTHGNRGIAELVEKTGSRAAATGAIMRSRPSAASEQLYLVLSADMIGKYPAIHRIGMWDFSSGNPPPAGYGSLQCSGRQGNIMECKEGHLNLRSGMLGDTTALSRIDIIEGGKVQRSLTFSRPDSRLSVQVLLAGNQPFAVYLMDESVYQSNFNQMFLRGQFNLSLFEEVYNGFPAVRIFRLKPSVDAG